ncbi:hypothetical protein HG531_010097 [Fusarium graminearum]|nr:hypothetical protein HG531_010097 [Fusarium graminearum]
MVLVLPIIPVDPMPEPTPEVPGIPPSRLWCWFTGRATEPSVLVLGRFAKTTRFLITGAHRAATGAGATTILVAEPMAVLAGSSSSTSSGHATGSKALGSMSNTVAFSARLGLVLAVVVTMEVHALITCKLLILKLLSVRLRASFELGKLLGSSLTKTSTLRSKLL